MSIDRFPKPGEVPRAPHDETAVPAASVLPVPDSQGGAQRFQSLVAQRAELQRMEAAPGPTAWLGPDPAGSGQAEAVRPESGGRSWRSGESDDSADDPAAGWMPPPLLEQPPIYLEFLAADEAAGTQSEARDQSPVSAQGAGTDAAVVAPLLQVEAPWASKAFAALHAGLASAPNRTGSSNRFSVDSAEWGRMGFIVRRDQGHTQVVVELGRDAFERAPEIRKSVQSWLEGRGHVAVRVAIALRASGSARRTASEATQRNDDDGARSGESSTDLSDTTRLLK